MAEIAFTLSEHDVERIARRVAELLPAPAASTPAEALQLFDERTAAKLLSVGASTLKRWRLEGKIRATRPIKPVGYLRDDIEAAL